MSSPAFFTVVGSREAPIDVVARGTKIVTALTEQYGYFEQGGDAAGMDQCHKGAAESKRIVVYPWAKSPMTEGDIVPTPPYAKAAMELAAAIHPAWDRCSDAAKRLHGRNPLQVLGPYLGDARAAREDGYKLYPPAIRAQLVETKPAILKSDFIICWAPPKGESCSGGTRTALEVGRYHGVPHFNLAKPEHEKRLSAFLMTLAKEGREQALFSIADLVHAQAHDQPLVVAPAEREAARAAQNASDRSVADQTMQTTNDNGFIIMRGLLTSADLAEIEAQTRDVIEAAPLVRHTMKSGAPFRFQMTCAGPLKWVSDQQGYRYEANVDKAGGTMFMAQAIDDSVQLALKRAGLKGPYQAQTALVNRYGQEAKLGEHRDVDERTKDPVVSISLGASCTFVVEGKEYTLNHGDVCILSGESRFAKHGVTAIHGKERLNITARQVVPEQLDIKYVGKRLPSMELELKNNPTPRMPTFTLGKVRKTGDRSYSYTGEYFGRSMPGIEGSPLQNTFRVNHESERGTKVIEFAADFAKKLERNDPAIIKELDRLTQIATKDGHLEGNCWCCEDKEPASDKKLNAILGKATVDARACHGHVIFNAIANKIEHGTYLSKPLQVLLDAERAITPAPFEFGEDVTIATGNIAGAKVKAIVNAVNCVGNMGSGIAKDVTDAFPQILGQYKFECDEGLLQPGEISVARTGAPSGAAQFVLNFATKDHYNKPSQIEWIDKGLAALPALCKEHGITSIAIPPLGCGRGGLDWNDVKPLIVQTVDELRAAGVAVTVYAPHELKKSQAIAAAPENPFYDTAAEVPPMPPRGEWLRNWSSNMLNYETPLVENGITYRAPENYYQAGKFADPAKKLEISKLNAFGAKKAGKGVHFPGGDDQAIAVMTTALEHRFSPSASPKFHEKLMATGRVELVEFCNWSDQRWGRQIPQNAGTNWKGKIEMKIRAAYQGHDVAHTDPRTIPDPPSVAKKQDRQLALV